MVAGYGYGGAGQYGVPNSGFNPKARIPGLKVGTWIEFLKNDYSKGIKQGFVQQIYKMKNVNEGVVRTGSHENKCVNHNGHDI